MKVVIDARFYGLENGGLGRYTVNLINELQKLDHKNEYFLLLREKWFNELNLTKNFEKVKVNSRHYSLREQFEVTKILQKINPDLTHFLHFNVPYFFNGKYIVTIHDLLMHQGVGRHATTLPSWKYKIKRLGYRKVFNHAVNSAFKIIVPTKFVKDEVLRTYEHLNKNEISVIYEGVTSLGSQREIKVKDKYFLYAGNAYPHKNLKTLIKAIKYVKDVKLVLVIPRDVFRERLVDDIEKLDAHHLVEMKSGVSDFELFSLYKNSIAFVYPSFSEGFGLQGLEAMGAGTRLLASDIPVFHEVYGENAIYFDPGDYEDLAVCLNKVLSESRSDRGKKIESAKKFVKKYSWEAMARGTLALYEG